jgi:hypothetical protein
MVITYHKSFLWGIINQQYFKKVQGLIKHLGRCMPGIVSLQTPVLLAKAELMGDESIFVSV